MAREWDLVLNKHSISRNEYRELLYFCRQYPDKKKELAECYCLEVVQPDVLPKGNGTSNPTESKALRAEKLSKDIALIESVALEVAPSFYSKMITHITEGKSYHSLNIPYSYSRFYDLRREFFYKLHEKKNYC